MGKLLMISSVPLPDGNYSSYWRPIKSSELFYNPVHTKQSSANKLYVVPYHIRHWGVFQQVQEACFSIHILLPPCHQGRLHPLTATSLVKTVLSLVPPLLGPCCANLSTLSCPQIWLWFEQFTLFWCELHPMLLVSFQNHPFMFYMVFKGLTVDQVIIKARQTNVITQAPETFLHAALKLGWCRIQAKWESHPLINTLWWWWQWEAGWPHLWSLGGRPCLDLV